MTPIILRAYVEDEMIEGRKGAMYPVVSYHWGIERNLDTVELITPELRIITLKTEHCDLMLYANKKDKDGNDLYQGDILKATIIHRKGIDIQGYPGHSWDEDCNKEVISEITFNGLEFWWSSICRLSEIGCSYQNPKEECRLSKLYHTSKHITGSNNDTYDNFVKIGNIFENRDLLR